MARRKPITNIDDPRWVRAISHPLRIRILAILLEQPTSPKMLAEQLDQPLGNTAYHVRTLHELGMIRLVSRRQRRGATEHYYEAVERPRFSDDAWERLDVVSKQRVLTAILDESHGRALLAAAGGGFDRADAQFTNTPLKLDEKGWTKLAQATKKLLETALKIEQESAQRLNADPHTAVKTGLIIQLFQAAEAPDHSRQQQPKTRSARTRREPSHAATELDDSP